MWYFILPAILMLIGGPHLLALSFLKWGEKYQKLIKKKHILLTGVCMCVPYIGTVTLRLTMGSAILSGWWYALTFGLGYWGFVVAFIMFVAKYHPRDQVGFN